MSKILFTAGPIPTRLDSVKYLTNRFRGGLAVATAEKLQSMGHQVTLVAWKYADLKTTLPIIRVEDVHDYYKTVLATQADAYVLAAAVANLGPLSPLPGKFPSHNYRVGDVFPIDFTIMPRVVDELKNAYPTATLIAYKLFDGSDEELVAAAQKTLFESRANLVFANHPQWAKERKIAVTADGAAFGISFDDHVDLMDRLIRAAFYRTEVRNAALPRLGEEDAFIIEHYPKHKQAGMTFGTFAIRTAQGFFTTTRGKKAGEKEVAFVYNVDHAERVVHANKKATLNAPLLHALLERNPHIHFLIHSHELIGDLVQQDYQFPGTDGDLLNALSTKEPYFLIQLPHHGYIAGFSDFSSCKKFILSHGHVG
ncbi:MAG TPA: phosphopantothenoylcysteine decarboxylase [Verrucomicrobiae bacterium]|nr:phosphopantothenoylcysteine decarboxylase [Verrucomicrobiae bacterium]